MIRCNVNDSKKVDLIYKDMLNNKEHYKILNDKDRFYVLTPEKSIMKINDIQEFKKDYEDNIFYKTEIIDKDIMVNKDDLNLYFEYIDKYKEKMMKTIYGDKYIFGSIAVRCKIGFITTIRGKEDLNDYTIVRKVDMKKHIVYVYKKKATLNAPLLDYLFKNEKVKVIVHINHEFDNKLEYLPYAFPGTVKDSIRDNTKSFNIRYHGLIYLFDKDGKLL